MSGLCKGERAEFEAESYVRGTLPADAAEAFEEHFFSCDPCLQHVEALQLTQEELRRSGLPSVSVESSSAGRGRSRWLVLGAAAAAVLVAVVGIGMIGLLRGRQQQLAKTQIPQPGPSSAAPAPAPQNPSEQTVEPPPAAEVQIAQLAEPVMPPYVPHTLRGETQIDVSFEKGMAAYSEKDCAGAVQHLEEVPDESASARAARLYSGACRLRLHELEPARRDLEAVVDAGDSPQQETAMFLLAQVELESGHSVRAKQLLEQTVSLQGDYERKARAQLKRLASIKVNER